MKKSAHWFRALRDSQQFTLWLDDEPK